MKLTKLLPWIVGVVALFAAIFGAMPQGKVNGFDINGFAKLPVLEGGRVKPLDSIARNSLLLARSKQYVRFEGKTVSADQWILDLMFRPEVADRQQVFNIDDPDVLGLIGLKQTSERYFSFETLAPHIDELEKQAKAAQPIDAKKRTRFQSAIVNLFDRVYMYFRLKNTLQLAGTPGLAVQMQAVAAPQAAEMHAALTQLAMFRILPPQTGEKADAWKSVGEDLQAGAMGQPLHPGLAPLSRIAAAYAAQDAAAFNSGVAEFQGIVSSLKPEAMSHANNEITFNRAQPFYVGMVLYIMALLMIFVSWLWKPELLQPSAFALLVAGAVVHTAGLAFRVILQGRPPVTNLYSSAVFVGWGAVVLGIVLERLYKKGFGTAVATAAGFGSLIVAQHLAEGDTMEMMRAVLDSNFWLATHVVTITIGYSGTFLAGAIAIAYTLWKHIAPDPDPETGKALVGMAYGIICFSLLFSFVGTVLGGIWADQSWGRFWGWDPKENGALFIVLWNAIILHARWSGMARDRGIMTMAIFGNVITSLSWFGVNMLGVGLHSYGFMDSAFVALSAFCASQGALMLLCMMPRRFQFQKPTTKKA
jgi:ABC-type transport system involved in cytochrome c biogenesis permease subunit